MEIQSFSNYYINTNIFNHSVQNVNGVEYSSIGPNLLVTKGDGNVTSLLAPDKGNEFPNTSILSQVSPIEFIVPGPIANIESGIEIGFNRFRESVPRVYPPIFLKRETK